MPVLAIPSDATLTDLQRTAASHLVALAGLGRMQALHPLAGGANNRLFRTDTDGGPAVLKLYFHHPDDPRNRLAAETAFVQFAQAGGIRCVPSLLGADPAHHMALYRHIPGLPLANTPTAAHVEQALAFVAALQGLRDRSTALQAGSEACFTLADHRRTVERRLKRLRFLSPDTPLHAEAARFITDEALPRWRTIAAGLPDDPAADPPLAAAERCLSPSDFGFHNALAGTDDQLVFLDFEYAGWDDPAKLVGDFFHQVAVPVPASFYRHFRDGVAGLFPDPTAVAARCDRLQPVYAIKWVTILLNDFLPVGGRRRAFAGTPDGTEDRHRRQLAKARTALARLDDIPGASP